MKQIAHGAEAFVYKDKLLGKDVCVKERISKKYRHPLLDKRIIKTRNKEEATLLKKIKEYGLNSPSIYYISENKIIMEFLEDEKKHNKMLFEIGEEIAKLHNNNIIHGDLNLINILINKNKVYFIDFGLGFVSLKIEDKATDLLVFKKTLLSLTKTEKYWPNILKGYLNKTNKKEIVKKINEIEKRARYL